MVGYLSQFCLRVKLDGPYVVSEPVPQSFNWRDMEREREGKGEREGEGEGEGEKKGARGGQIINICTHAAARI